MMTGTSANTKRFGRQQSLRRPPVEKGRWAAKGTKPLPDQLSIKHIISVMVIHLCRKVLFIDIKVKITLYSLALFFGSLIFDFIPAPRTYLSYKDNVLNLYFVKIGWAWLLFIVGSFVYLTSATYGCGKAAIIQQHMGRLVVGTIVWWFTTQWLFVSIESATGTCLGKSTILDKYSCVTSGFQWQAFDISGHAFLLVYMNLVTVEEAQAIVGWEAIREMIFHEEHYRKSEPTTPTSMTPDYSTSSDAAGSSSSNLAQSDSHNEQDSVPLRMLTNNDFITLKTLYEGNTLYIRIMFIFMTFFSVTSDVLLACTVIYFHTMPQKLVGGALAILAWYGTYRVLFQSQWPGLPGEGGLVKYRPTREKDHVHMTKKKPVIITKDHQQVPMFMGMPMYGAVKRDDKQSHKEGLGEEGLDDRQADTAGKAPYSPGMGGARRNKFSNVWR